MFKKIIFAIAVAICPLAAFAASDQTATAIFDATVAEIYTISVDNQNFHFGTVYPGATDGENVYLASNQITCKSNLDNTGVTQWHLRVSVDDVTGSNGGPALPNDVDLQYYIANATINGVGDNTGIQSGAPTWVTIPQGPGYDDGYVSATTELNNLPGGTVLTLDYNLNVHNNAQAGVRTWTVTYTMTAPA
jgi:hypothetical protein